jgi:hypothetical protein
MAGKEKKEKERGKSEKPAKKKVVPEKFPMPEQPPAERVHNFKEVPYGYNRRRGSEAVSAV